MGIWLFTLSTLVCPLIVGQLVEDLGLASAIEWCSISSNPGSPQASLLARVDEESIKGVFSRAEKFDNLIGFGLLIVYSGVARTVGSCCDAGVGCSAVLALEGAIIPDGIGATIHAETSLQDVISMLIDHEYRGCGSTDIVVTS